MKSGPCSGFYCRPRAIADTAVVKTAPGKKMDAIVHALKALGTRGCQWERTPTTSLLDTKLHNTEHGDLISWRIQESGRRQKPESACSRLWYCAISETLSRTPKRSRLGNYVCEWQRSGVLFYADRRRAFRESFHHGANHFRSTGTRTSVGPNITHGT
jgi:hypothetical protein